MNSQKNDAERKEELTGLDKQLDAETARKIPKELLGRISGGDSEVPSQYNCPRCHATLYFHEYDDGRLVIYCRECGFLERWR